MINDKIKKIQEIKSFADNFRVLYVELDLPWPIDNRDFVYAERFINRDDGILIHSKSIEGVLPEVHNIVRGDRFLYGMYLKRVSDNVTEITGIISVDPKGSLPNMMKSKMSITEYSKAKKLKNTLLSMP